MFELISLIPNIVLLIIIFAQFAILSFMGMSKKQSNEMKVEIENIKELIEKRTKILESERNFTELVEKSQKFFDENLDLKKYRDERQYINNGLEEILSKMNTKQDKDELKKEIEGLIEKLKNHDKRFIKFNRKIYYMLSSMIGRRKTDNDFIKPRKFESYISDDLSDDELDSIYDDEEI